MIEPIMGRIKLIPEWMFELKIKESWCVICYLIINWKIDELARRIKDKPGNDFYKAVGHYIYNYVYKDKMPPEEIAPAILNLAEDFMSGNPVKFRAGDYIAVQNYIRMHK